MLGDAKGYGYLSVLFAARLLDDAEPDVAFAVQLAAVGNEASFNTNYAHLSILAVAQWQNGQRAAAIQTQTQAASLCKALKADCEDVESRLAEFRAETK